MDRLLDAPPRVRARFPLANVALFLATVASTTLAGGAAYAAALITILLAHEMGHFTLARRYGVDATLPYFIPLPMVGSFGTLGAVIRIRSALPSRRATFDIGAAGPLAGFAVALPLLLWGLAHSRLEVVEAAQRVHGLASPWDALRLWLAGKPILGGGGGGDLIVLGDSLLTRAAERLVVGPKPPGAEVILHPVALAAWLGLFVTTLNLVPVGQLDGGHVAYALLGRRGARAVAQLVSAALLAAGLFLSFTWLVWWAISRWLVRVGHPPALVEEPLDPGRRLVALFSLAVFVLTFVPVPVSF